MVIDLTRAIRPTVVSLLSLGDFPRSACALIVLGLLTGTASAQWSPDDFDKKIAPIFAEHCLSCHHGAEPKGGLDLASHAAATRGGESGAAVVPDDLDNSLLWQRVESGEMPPEKELPDSDRELIRRWIESGARWGKDPIDPFRTTTTKRAGYDWWSLQPIKRPEVPRVEGARTPIDAFVRHRLSIQGLAPSPRASVRQIARRLSFDLLGMPPRQIDVDEFELAMRRHPDTAIGVYVDRLLSSPEFGERWARHWLDVVRFGESQGFERDRLRENSWYYRDWVIDAFNNDLPYDKFVTLQLAGDVIDPADPESVIATGFLVAGAWDEVGQKQQSAAMKAVVRQDELEDYVGTIGQAFLGLTVNCARCHDHKFDPISQEEYYRLSACLAGVHHGSRDLVTADQTKINVYAAKPSPPHTVHMLARGNPHQLLQEVTPGGVTAITDLNAEFGLDGKASDASRRRALADWITHRGNPLFARVIANRLWHYHFGSGIVDTPNDFGFNGGRPSHPELLDYLASELIDSGYSLKRLHRLIVCSDTYLQASVHRSECASVDASNQLFWRKDPMRLDAETLRDTILCVAGQLNSKYGGPAYRDFTTHVHNSQFYEMTDEDSPTVYRRTIYRTWIRSGRNHLLDVFDCPDPSTTAPRRSMTTTPLQALTLMNNSFVLRMADRFAGRLVSDVGHDSSDQATGAYQLAYGRLPNESERDMAAAFIESEGLSAFCRVIFNSNEFIYVD